MSEVFLSLGSNIGNKVEQIEKAYIELENSVGQIVSKSSFYETAPWGFKSSNFFINTVILVETELSPEEILVKIKEIEKSFGRKKTKKDYEDRPIDIDILYYDRVDMSTTSLTIPHPLISKRKFVLLPLLEVVRKINHFRREEVETMVYCCGDKSRVDRVIECK
jgi:2-amino-4-hydroxy-6-hydroxymethyldihydropteridine diphosphokinase